jgi:hypothetical protein
LWVGEGTLRDWAVIWVSLGGAEQYVAITGTSGGLTSLGEAEKRVAVTGKGAVV